MFNLDFMFNVGYGQLLLDRYESKLNSLKNYECRPSIWLIKIRQAVSEMKRADGQATDDLSITGSFYALSAKNAQ
jgi:hypothetical protein